MFYAHIAEAARRDDIAHLRKTGKLHGGHHLDRKAFVTIPPQYFGHSLEEQAGEEEGAERPSTADPMAWWGHDEKRVHRGERGRGRGCQ